MLVVIVVALILGAAGIAYYSGRTQGASTSSSPASTISSGSATNTTGESTSTTSSSTTTTTSSTSLTSGQLPAIFPRSNPPGELVVVGVNSSNSFGYELAALQGIVARTQPRLFLVNRPDDRIWLDYTVSKYGLTYQNSTSAQALQMFKDYVSDSAGRVRVVVYDSDDPIFPAQVNIARTLAGVYDALPVSSNDLPGIQAIYGTTGIYIVQDLRGLFSDKLTAYTWLWTHYGANLTRSFTTISPSGGLGLTDYIVEFRSFVFEFSTSNSLSTAETQFAAGVLGSYAPMTPVLGFFGLGGESPTVSFLSQRQMLMVPGDEVMDLSVYSGLPEALNLKQAQPPSSPTYDPSKTYVMFSFSQGTSLGFDFYANRELWSQNASNGQPLRTEIPEAWQIDPLAAELAPQLIQYYYGTMSQNDSFYTGASGGAGYVHPDELPDLAQYLGAAKAFDSNLGVDIYFIVASQSGQLQTSLYQSYVSAANPLGILQKQNKSGPPQLVSGVPVMGVTYTVPSITTFGPSDVASTVGALEQLSAPNKFIFVFMNAKNPGLQFIADVLQQLGPSFVALRADQFVRTYLSSLDAQAPAGPRLSPPRLAGAVGSLITSGTPFGLAQAESEFGLPRFESEDLTSCSQMTTRQAALWPRAPDLGFGNE